jgi:hypothetical protein
MARTYASRRASSSFRLLRMSSVLIPAVYRRSPRQGSQRRPARARRPRIDSEDPPQLQTKSPGTERAAGRRANPRRPGRTCVPECAPSRAADALGAARLRPSVPRVRLHLPPLPSPSCGTFGGPTPAPPPGVGLFARDSRSGSAGGIPGRDLLLRAASPTAVLPRREEHWPSAAHPATCLLSAADQVAAMQRSPNERRQLTWKVMGSEAEGLDVLPCGGGTPRELARAMRLRLSFSGRRHFPPVFTGRHRCALSPLPRASGRRNCRQGGRPWREWGRRSCWW